MILYLHTIHEDMILSIICIWTMDLCQRVLVWLWFSSVPSRFGVLLMTSARTKDQSAMHNSCSLHLGVSKSNFPILYHLVVKHDTVNSSIPIPFLNRVHSISIHFVAISRPRKIPMTFQWLFIYPQVCFDRSHDHQLSDLIVSVFFLITNFSWSYDHIRSPW